MTSVWEPWALLACSIGTMIGGAKYISFRMCEWVLKWSGGVKASDQKRGIPLVCELGLLRADEDYGEALQARARARMGGARRQNVFLADV